MDFPKMMKAGAYSEPFYIEYMKRDAPFSMANNHFHPYYEVYFLLSGSRIYFIKDTTYAIEASDLVFINKHEVHKTLHAGHSGHEHERIVIHFDDRFVRDVFKQHAPLLLRPFEQHNPIVRLPEQGREQVGSLIKQLLVELRDKSMGYEILLYQAITELLLLSSRYVTTSGPPEPIYTSPLNLKISEIVRYLNVNYSEQIRIQALAERFFISPYYMSRVFKEVTGFTLIDYLNLTRIKEAQRLLRETGFSITDIAARVGFDNFSHFGKIFKKITRTSARDYRKENRMTTLH
jgi:AraC-like DNA-binding protein